MNALSKVFEDKFAVSMDMLHGSIHELCQVINDAIDFGDEDQIDIESIEEMSSLMNKLEFEVFGTEFQAEVSETAKRLREFGFHMEAKNIDKKFEKSCDEFEKEYDEDVRRMNEEYKKAVKAMNEGWNW